MAWSGTTMANSRLLACASSTRLGGLSLTPRNEAEGGETLATVSHATHVPLTGGPQRVLQAVPATRPSDYFAGLLFKALGSAAADADRRAVADVYATLSSRLSTARTRTINWSSSTQ